MSLPRPITFLTKRLVVLVLISFILATIIITLMGPEPSRLLLDKPPSAKPETVFANDPSYLSPSKNFSNPAVDRLLDLFEFSDEVPLKESDIYGLSKRCRLFRDLSNVIYDARGNLHPDAVFRAGGKEKVKKVEEALGKMEAFLFPFFQKDNPIQSLNSLLKSYNNERGIVLSTGNFHYRYALHLIQTIRLVFNSHLPIEIFYYGDKDLSADKIKELEKVSRVRVIDLSKLVNSVGIGGWSMKSFMILFSSFSEVIFMDADALFLQDPEVVFRQKGYIETGTLLFRDRTMKMDAESGKHANYVRSIIREPSEYALQGRIFRKLSVHEGESGVLVFDKARTFHVLLLLCKMNTDYFKKEFYDVFYGDKETFWVAFEAMRVPYFLNKAAGGAVGYRNPENGHICGGLYHPDENMKPLWFNGGIVPNKHYDGDAPMQLTHWATDTTWGNVIWDWETSTSPFCMMPVDPEKEIGTIDGPFAATASGLVKVWNENVKPRIA
ncbi:mannosyltransferase putative-domain-containing protein [Polychytrium aggregatum]|uniref:mannosyltransferase putative-domain-containing protein n=1 Tax=Polychytrium aggregatum TaxID=110093 RepID=UPI0022FDEB2A|nr:mannosyltransferase putative-domain-containing protein [Polychytrium aggregatum]KAI9206494.1 mannosyltransferase putative-domain-containing protein [Polychytrium aggregatum]